MLVNLHSILHLAVVRQTRPWHLWTELLDPTHCSPTNTVCACNQPHTGQASQFLAN